MSTPKTKILIVEDDTSMGFLLVDFLETNHFDVTLCKDGVSGWKSFNQNSYDFCLLDIMLPGMDGYSLAEKIRETDKVVPIIFLTARTMKVDKIKGFHIGVDDYVTKPFDEDELLCRINAILNRLDSNESKAKPVLDKLILQSYTFDVANQLLLNDMGARRLTKKESEVLFILCQYKNKIVKRETILNTIWGDDNYFNGRSLDVFITKLRKYLQDDDKVVIENIPKVGFVLNC